MQQGPEILSGHQVSETRRVFEGQDSVTDLRVETAMPDEMQDVVVVPVEGLAQPGQGGMWERVNDDQATIDQTRQRRGHPGNLSIGIKLGQVGRATDREQDPQWWRHGQRRHLTGQIEIADDRRRLGQDEESAQARGIQVFPRDVGEGRNIGEPQLDPQALALLVGLVEAAPEAGADLSSEHRVIKLGAERARELLLGRTQGPHA